MRRLAIIAAGLPSVVGFVGAAPAADLPAHAYTKAPAMVADIYNWTGFYVGIEGGGDWGRSQHYQNDPAASAANVNPGTDGFDGGSGFRGGGTGGARGGGGLVAGPPLLGLTQTSGIDLSGVLLGGTIGYNYQFRNNIVAGIENDVSWSNTKGSANLIPPFFTTQIFQTSQTWLDTLRGRIGYARNRLLVYGTGGAAFTNESILLCDPIAAGCGSQSKIVTGWTAGVGAEYSFRDNWSVKLEYLHADFGTQFYPRTFTPVLFANGSSFFAARNVTLTNDIIRAGVNYKFGWGGPVVAK